MAINVSVQYYGGFLPDIILLIINSEPRLLPSGNPLNTIWMYVETLSLQLTKQYIITTMFDVVLNCFCFVFAFCLVSLHGD